MSLRLSLQFLLFVFLYCWFLRIGKMLGEQSFRFKLWLWILIQILWNLGEYFGHILCREPHSWLNEKQFQLKHSRQSHYNSVEKQLNITNHVKWEQLIVSNNFRLLWPANREKERAREEERVGEGEKETKLSMLNNFNAFQTTRSHVKRSQHTWLELCENDTIDIYWKS